MKIGKAAALDFYAENVMITRNIERVIIMKKLLHMASFAALLGLSGCASAAADTTEPVTKPQEEKVFKVLLIGQSLGQDSVWLLHQVMKTERPDKKFLVADIYESIALGQHRINIQQNAAVYHYHKFSDNGADHRKGVSIYQALRDEVWDLIIFNDATYPTTQPREFEDGDHAFMIDYIRKNATPGFKLAYNATWANPTDARLWDESRRSIPPIVHERYAKEFGGSRNLYYEKTCANIKTYIETNQEFDMVFHPGTAIQYATETHGVPEAALDHNFELYRDYVHMSDYGRLLVAYQLYAQIFGLEKLEAVNVDRIKAEMRFRSEQKYGDIELTQQQKDAIIASVNFALAHPNEVPPQTARAEAFLERPDLMPQR